MKKRYIGMSLSVLLLSLLLATPVFAYTGIEGLVSDDSDNPQPWQHGGIVSIYGDPGSGMQLIGTCYLGESGDFVGEIVANASTGGSCTYPAPNPFTTVYVIIDPAPGPAGDPGDIQCDFLEISSNDPKNLGYMKLENTGRNAVVMIDSLGTSGMALAGVLPLAAVASLGALKLNRKKRQ